MIPLTSSPLAGFHPILQAWFTAEFGTPTKVQLEAWEAIISGSHALIAAPTGSGKTLAALLPCIDRLVKEKLPSGEEAENASSGVRILYITPLKALNNDIHHHTIQFIEAIEGHARGIDSPWPGIRSAVRTGDTPARERAAMAKRPPDMLVTTPESLYIMLTSEKGRSMLRSVRQVIIDEIHNLAPDKRGAHLSLSLERLTAFCGRKIQRIGVSATQKPLDRVARFLAGWEASPDGPPSSPRPVTIIESPMQKRIELTVTMPDYSKPVKTRESLWFPIMDRLLQLIGESRSTLIFVNSRRICERLCLRLNDYVGYEMARAHHGSMDRERRLEVERLLKEGQLRALVATSSLELGIDVGHVDLVIQIDSPFDAAAGIQRIGRAGHAVGDVSRGVILARERGSLPEIALLSRLIAGREIEEIRIPQHPLDVLSQQLVAMAATDDWPVDGLYRLITQSDTYRHLSKDRLLAVLQVLSGMYPFARPLLAWDKERDVLTRRRNSAMAAVTGSGTIPQSSAYPVHHIESRAHLGELDEEFVHESRVGDVFQLGTSSWMIRDIRKDRIYVSEAPNRFSEIPFWRNEAGSRSYELGEKLGIFLEELSRRLEAARDGKNSEQDVMDWLVSEYYMDAESARQLIGFIQSQLSVSTVPTHRRIVIEHYQDLTGRTHVLIHNHWGRRVNRTWLLAIERGFKRLLPYRLYGNAKDNGIEFVLPEWDDSWLQALYSVTSSGLKELLMEAIPGSPLLAIAFRRIAETSLLLSRSFTRMPMWQKRLRSEELLKESLPFAERFPFLQEAIQECLHSYLDLDRLEQLLDRVAAGSIEIVIRKTDHPSPLAAQFIADYVNMQMYEGDGLDNAVQLQLLQAGKALAGELFGQEALRRAFDPEVMEKERERMKELTVQPRHADDLLLLLKRRGDLSEAEIAALTGEEAAGLLEELTQSRQVVQLEFGRDWRWICEDELELYAQFPRSEASVALIAGRYADHCLSFTEADLKARYPALSAEDAEHVIEMLLQQDKIEQAPFAAHADERIWCSRKVASRIVRRSMEHARKQAEPVDPVRWCGQMALMQHALPGAQLRGEEGLLGVITKLQGMYLPLSLWETLIFPSRIVDYRKDDLDRLCASGEIVWLGKKGQAEKEGKVAFFLTESKPLYAPYLRDLESNMPNSSHPELLGRLRSQGATFLTKLSRDTGQLPSELLSALFDLVWEGQVSNDQFTPLRLHAATKGKGLAKAGSGQGRWYWTGSLADELPDRPDPASGSGAGFGSGQSPIESSAASWIHHLLQSYGLITKELAAAVMPFDWDTLLPLLRKLEEWGAVTRGMFIRDHPTMQFSSREMTDAVRAPLTGPAVQSLTLLSAVDPANPFGLVSGWPASEAASYARKPGNYLVLQGERWRYWIENNGRKIYDLNGNDHGETDKGDFADLTSMKEMLRTLLKLQGASKIKIDTWNGTAVEQSSGGPLLRRLGAERDNKSLVLWASQLKS
ncbi:DEAD/DEAH box helicase [Paenibacillus tarimensis]